MARQQVTVNLDPRQIERLKTDPPTQKEIRRAGYQLAKKAALQAPRNTGRGANSIRGQVSAEDPTAADVAWGQRYYYMIFHEDGYQPSPTSPRRAGEHFLRNAFEHYIHV